MISQVSGTQVVSQKKTKNGAYQPILPIAMAFTALFIALAAPVALGTEKIGAYYSEYAPQPGL